MQITVELLSGGTMKWIVDDSKDSVQSVMVQFTDGQGGEAIKFGAMQHSVGDTIINEYHLEKEPSLSLRPRSPIPIIVITPKGKRLVLRVDPFDKIGSIQMKIEETEGIKVEDQRFIFIDKKICPSSTFASHNIQKHDSIKLVLGLGGPIRFCKIKKGKRFIFETVEAGADSD